MARSPSSDGRHRSAPYITANDLARFMKAGYTGQVGIIQRSRDSKSAITARYAKVREDIRDYLCDSARTPRMLLALQNKYQQIADNPANSSWSRGDALLSVEALKSLARLENKIAGGRFVRAPTKQVPLVISGVTVSVFLNVLMVREHRGVEEVGGVLFRLSKAEDETDAAASKRNQMGAIAATLALMQVEARHKSLGQPQHQLCGSFDIQCEDIHWAPRSYAKTIKEVENACRFIAALWDTA